MRASDGASDGPNAGMRDVQHHPLVVRITHWATALAVLIMIGSGWRIYDQEPILGFIHFPIWATLGGEPSHSQAINDDTGYANAVLWHFASPGCWWRVSGSISSMGSSAEGSGASGCR